MSGILNWALVGLKRLRENGRLSAAAAVCEAVAEYRQESNPTSEWLAERTVPLAEADTGARALHLDYLTWCKQLGSEPLNAKNFGENCGDWGSPRSVSRRAIAMRLG